MSKVNAFLLTPESWQMQGMTRSKQMIHAEIASKAFEKVIKTKY